MVEIKFLSLIHVPGYNIYRKDRLNCKGGGVMIYVKNEFQCASLDLSKSSLECVGIKISLSLEMNFILIVVYRPPSTKDTIFNDLTDMLRPFNASEIILMGDFNLNWLDKTRRKKLKDITAKYHLSQLINSTTRITWSCQTVLDLIFVNKPDRIT